MNYLLETFTSGEGRGKEMGFPTLNFKIPEDFSFQYGVYAGWITIGDKKYGAAIHYGPIPVFGEYNEALEVHVIDADLKETPEKAMIEIVEFLRDIKQCTVAELVEQIKKDIIETKKILT